MLTTSENRSPEPEAQVDLPPVTIVIEWENAIDVHDEWTARAMAALQRELEAVASRTKHKPRITYLYDDTAVDPTAIRMVIDKAAPRLRDLSFLEILPAPGLTYYKLKNYGIARAETELSIMLDSDAAPQPGWLEGLLSPFSDPEIMAVGGFTTLGYEGFLSKTMALAWIFDLPHERDRTVRRRKINANNCAVRTDFFRDNPFPDLPTFKKQCRFWLRDLSSHGVRYVRTADAMTVHAPHPGVRFLAWRAWTGGLDADFVGHTLTNSRFGRLRYAFKQFWKKTSRSCSRILRQGDAVDLPMWQRPGALLIASAFYGVTLVAQVSSALYRSFPPLEELMPSVKQAQA